MLRVFLLLLYISKRIVDDVDSHVKSFISLVKIVEMRHCRKVPPQTHQTDTFSTTM